VIFLLDGFDLLFRLDPRRRRRSNLKDLQFSLLTVDRIWEVVWGFFDIINDTREELLSIGL
jgi:hypothetical protein